MNRTTDAARKRARTRALKKLAQRLGHDFEDLGHLDRALCHASTGNEGKPNYERMEFLGDAFLGFAIADALYRREPEIPEGELTETRARLVSRGPLARVARELDLVSCLEAGKGMLIHASQSPRILADLVEAVIAAIYLDGGIRPARSFVRRHVLSLLDDDAAEERPNRDAKSRLLHQVQRAGLGQPTYRVVAVTGLQHQQEFEVAVQIDGKELARGAGRSKQTAEKRAAARALEAFTHGDEDGAPPRRRERKAKGRT